jgi:hypothetical protein
MTHEKIFKRKDGSRVKVSVWLYVHQNQSNWGYSIFLKEAGSEQWIDPFSNTEYITRVVKPSSGESTYHDTFDNYISKKEILEAKLELWQIIKPTI